MKSRENEYREALGKCLDRYEEMGRRMGCFGRPELLAFIREFRENLDTHSIEKLNRWLGYIQGVLIERGLTTVEAERDWTRPLFRPLDYTEEQ